MNGRTDERMNPREEPMRPMQPVRPMRPILQGWLDRHEPAPSGDLLFQVMREVETVEQKGSTRAWLSWFADSPAAGWMMATAAVAALAVAVVVFVNNPFGTTAPAGTGASATPTATVEPSPDAYPSPLGLPTDELVDQLFADWTAGDYDAAMRIYTPFADFRWADDAPAWNIEAEGRTQLKSLVADGKFTFTRTGNIVQQGNWIGVPLTYAMAGYEGDGVAVLKILNGFVVHHFTFGADHWPLSEAQSGYGLGNPIPQIVDAQIAALNAHDGAANAAFFAANGQMRIYVGTWAVAEEWLSPEKVAEWTANAGEIDFQLTRPDGWLVRQGAFVFYPWIVTTTNGEAEGVLVMQLNAENRIVNYWTVGD